MRVALVTSTSLLKEEFRTQLIGMKSTVFGDYGYFATTKVIDSVSSDSNFQSNALPKIITMNEYVSMVGF